MVLLNMNVLSLTLYVLASQLVTIKCQRRGQQQQTFHTSRRVIIVLKERSHIHTWHIHIIESSASPFTFIYSAREDKYRSINALMLLKRTAHHET